MRGRRRRGVAVTVEAVFSVMNVDTSSSVVSILVDGVLHLAKNGVDVNEILLSSRAGHGQVVLLSQGVLARSRTSVDRCGSRLRHVLLGSSHRTVGNGEVAMEGHQGTTNLGIRRRIDLSTLGAAEEVVNHVVGALSIITAGSSAVSKVLGTGIVDRRLVEVEAIVGRGLGSIVTATRMACLMSKGCCVSSHLTSVIIVARGALWRLWPVVESTLRILGWANKYRVIGMGLDMLLQVLRTLERLAAELTLVRLERNMDTDVRGDVVSLDRGSSARVPLASQVEVVCALATNMALANMLVESLGSRELLVASIPSADKVIVA